MNRIIERLYFVKLLWLWTSAFWTVVLILIAGALFFADAVVQSIKSTPHPELVYIIFAVAGCAVWLLARTLHHYTVEDRLIVQLSDKKPQERNLILNALSWDSDLIAVYRLLNDLHGVGTTIRVNAIGNELIACEDKALSRLA